MDFKIIDIGFEPPQKKKVLVVDDETALHSLIYDTLINDYQVVSAHNAKEGIKKAEGLKPDLIFMDVMMPDMNGYDAVKLLGANEATRNIPIIVTSARDFDASTIKMIRGEANVAGFLAKPFRVAELRNLVTSIFVPK